MSFTPTKESLEELGFKEWIWWDMIYTWITFQIRAEITQSWSKFTQVMVNHMWHTAYKSEVYPKSIEDIQTLIKLLTPPN